MANNANVQVLNENISTITAEARDLHSTLVTAQQQLASLLAGQRVAAPATPAKIYVSAPIPIYTPAAYDPPPLPPAAYATTTVPTYVPAATDEVPAYTHTPTTQYQDRD